MVLLVTRWLQRKWRQLTANSSSWVVKSDQESIEHLVIHSKTTLLIQTIWRSLGNTFLCTSLGPWYISTLYSGLLSLFQFLVLPSFLVSINSIFLPLDKPSPKLLSEGKGKMGLCRHSKELSSKFASICNKKHDMKA